MIKAVIFDFDGIIADTEELHFTCLKDILHQEGIFINRQTYDEIYLALDDKNCFKRAFATAKSKELSHQEIEELVKRKANLLQSNLTEVKLFSGTSEWIKKHASEVLLGICSGALDREITQVLSKHSLLEYFAVIVTAEDVEQSKPSPEGYLLALQRLQEISGGHISPSECLVIEDSVAGIEAAKAARMYCVAITNSYSREKLCQADVIFDSILELSLERLNIRLRPPDILPSG